MDLEQEKRISQKYKAKPGINELGLKLAKKLYPMAETTVDDVIERLFVEKAFQLGILTDEEKKGLPEEIRGKSVTSGFIQMKEKIEVPDSYVPPMKQYIAPSVLPLGEVRQAKG